MTLTDVKTAIAELKQNSTVKSIVIGLVILVVGYAFGRYASPQKVVTKIEFQTDITKTNEKDHTTTQTTIIKPDGTKIVINQDETQDIIKQQTEIQEKFYQDIQNSKPNWKVSALVQKEHDRTISNLVYGAHVEKRFIGPVFLGAYGNTASDFGLSLGIEF